VEHGEDYEDGGDDTADVESARRGMTRGQNRVGTKRGGGRGRRDRVGRGNSVRLAVQEEEMDHVEEYEVGGDDIRHEEESARGQNRRGLRRGHRTGVGNRGDRWGGRGGMGTSVSVTAPPSWPPPSPPTLPWSW